MNQVMVNIKSRRSIRDFSEAEIPDDIINKIIEAARYAPSALNKQAWKFIVITNKGVIRKLSGIVKEKCLKVLKFLPLLGLFNSALRDPQTAGAIKKTLSKDGDTVFYNAPLLIIVAADKRGAAYISKDCAMASENMMLYATSIGVNSCFIGRADFLGMSKTAKEIIGLPPYYSIQSALVFGYASQNQKRVHAPARRSDNIINWVR